MAIDRRNVSPLDMVNAQGWKVFSERLGWSDETRIWLGMNKTDGFYNATVGKDGRLVMEKVVEGAANPPALMTLPTPVWQLVVDAIAEKTPPMAKERMTGELDATKYHLEDLRKLVLKDRA